MSHQPDLTTLPQRMLWAADVLAEANERYNLHPDAPCSASWLRNEARHVEDEDKEAAEKDALVEDLARELFNAQSARYPNRNELKAWDEAGTCRDDSMGLARALIDNGWTKS